MRRPRRLLLLTSSPPSSLLLLVVVLAASAAAAAAAADLGHHQPLKPAAVLRPFQHVKGQLLALDGGAVAYALAGLRPDTRYELRVSFPASIPAAVHFEVVDGAAARARAHSVGAAADWLRRRRGRLLLLLSQHEEQQQREHPQPLLHGPRRRLLDCEKLEFATDADGRVRGLVEPWVLLRAARRSVHRDGPSAGASQLVYNVVLADVVRGLPRDAWPAALAVAALAVLGLAWAVVWSQRVLPLVLDWVCSGSSSSSSTSTKGGGSSSAAGGGGGSSSKAAAAAAARGGAAGGPASAFASAASASAAAAAAAAKRVS